MRLEYFRKIINLLVFLTVIDAINCEYYTSISGLEDLLKAENHYVLALEKHLAEVEKLNENVQRLLGELELQNSKVQNNITHDSEDPLTSFKSIRRLVVDVQHVQDLTQQIQDLQVYNETSTIHNLPTIDDLRGAARGLTLLQRIYKLESASMAKGYLKNQKYSREMSAFNCFVLGQSLYELGEFAYAGEWLIEALNKVKDPDNSIYPYITVIQILEYLPSAAYMAGNRQLALDFNNILLSFDQNNAYGLANSHVFENGIRENRRKRILNIAPTGSTKMQELYGQVCSGELQQSDQAKRNLHCRYVTKNVPYYLVGPLKMEELSLEPFVSHYYEVIHDSEIRQLIKAVEGTIVTSRVGELSMARVDIVRTSKNSWLSFEDHKFLHKISQRLEDITGLSIESAEQLQVANYGIGGHYAPHFDFTNNPEQNFFGNGNRLLTALFYINEVELGGGTGFPLLHLMVPPIKGSLVVWYNLHRSLEPDYRTMHAGCPVLKGSKWICNEWFHTLGQEFKRPCGLKPDQKISEAYQYLHGT